MKKTFLTLLISALVVWGYVVAQVLIALAGKSESHAAPEKVPAVLKLARAGLPLDTSFRDPFQSYLYAQKPPPVVAKAAPALKVVEPPAAVLNGILWGDSPVAILKLGDKTELVKAGTEVWDMKVLKVERHQVVVQKQGRQFTLQY